MCTPVIRYKVFAFEFEFVLGYSMYHRVWRQLINRIVHVMPVNAVKDGGTSIERSPYMLLEWKRF